MVGNVLKKSIARCTMHDARYTEKYNASFITLYYNVLLQSFYNCLSLWRVLQCMHFLLEYQNGMNIEHQMVTLAWIHNVLAKGSITFPIQFNSTQFRFVHSRCWIKWNCLFVVYTKIGQIRVLRYNWNNWPPFIRHPFLLAIVCVFVFFFFSFFFIYGPIRTVFLTPGH